MGVIIQKTSIIAKPAQLHLQDTIILKIMHRCCFGDCPEPDWDDDYWWYVTENDLPVAFGGMGIMDGEGGDKIGIFTRVGVLPHWRGEGLQVKLIHARLNYAKRQNCIRCVTYTVDNPASENSLINCGFKRYQPVNPWAGKVTYWRSIL